MRNILKKAAAVVLALTLCLSFAGCYSEDRTWAAKMGDDTMPIGGYIYYLTSAYSEAAPKISSDTEVLKGQVDGEDASTWIKNRAMEYLGAYYYVTSKFDELGLELTDEEIASAETSTSNTWTYYKASFEEQMGIAQSSFHQAYSLYNLKYQKVLAKMYGDGGELEIPEDELKSYYTENYYSYEYFYAPLSKTNEEGNSEDLTDDEKSELKKKLEDYAKKINSGDTTTSEAANEYSYEANGSADSSTYTMPTPAKKEAINSAISEALDGMKDDEASFVETTSGYYVVKKLSIADKFQEVTEDETQKTSLLLDMKGEEFSDYVIEQGKDVQVEINQKAIDSIKLSSLVLDGNKNGTSSASSEASSETSSESDDASSSVSSEVETESSQTE